MLNFIKLHQMQCILQISVRRSSKGASKIPIRDHLPCANRNHRDLGRIEDHIPCANRNHRDLGRIEMDSIMVEGDRNSAFPGRSSTPSEQSSKLDQICKEDSTDLADRTPVLKIRPYTRRNRSRSNRVNIIPPLTGYCSVDDQNRPSILPSSNCSRRSNSCKINTPKDHAIPSISTLECPNGKWGFRPLASNTQWDMKFNAARAETTTGGLQKVGVQLQKEEYSQQHSWASAKEVSGVAVSSGTNDVAVSEVEVLFAHNNYAPSPADKKVKNLCIQHYSGFLPREDKNGSINTNAKPLEQEYSFDQFCCHLCQSNSRFACQCSRKLEPNLNYEEQTSDFKGTPKMGVDLFKENGEMKDVDIGRNDHVPLKEEAIARGLCSEDISTRILNSSNFVFPVNSHPRGNPRTVEETCTSWDDKDKHKEIVELPVGSFTLYKRQNSHWDVVLEEMQWLAHDFMQERIWKITAAAQVSHWMSSAVLHGLDEKNLCRKQRQESLFYITSLGAMEHYRKSVESDGPDHHERSGSKMHQKENGFSEYNATSGYQTRANTFEYNGGTQNIHGGWRGQKKSSRSSRNHSNVVVGDLPPRSHTEQKLGDGSSIPMGKRSYGILGFGSISTKRARTALRRRIRSTLVDSASGGVQVETKPGVSSGDTNSFGDKQNSVRIKLQTSKSLSINSTSDVRELLPTDYTGTLAIPEKVKSMQLGTTFEQRWQQDPTMPKEQALCDLILDLGANWELVSDAINNGVLEMDSVVNMSWHSEDTLKVDALKSRFQKIIMLWKQQNDLKVQNNHLNEKGVLPVHSSHLLSVSRVSSNGDPLTPLDHCESGTVGTDAISSGYQSCPTSDLGSSDIIMVPVHVTSACSMLQESSSGNSLPSSTFTASSRHSQNSNFQRQSNQLISEREHVKQLSQVLAIGKNQQSGFSTPEALLVSDCDVETQPGEGGMSMVHESSRSTPLPKPRLQRRGASSRVRRPSMYAGEASGQGGSSVRPSHGVRISL